MLPPGRLRLAARPSFTGSAIVCRQVRRSVIALVQIDAVPFPLPRVGRTSGAEKFRSWLTGRLMPDFKTIAGFRKDNGEGHTQGLP
jgi:hypothetical protein